MAFTLEDANRIETFPELLEKTGLKMSWISNKYGVSYRTVQDWKSGNGKIAGWALRLMAKDIALNIQNEPEGAEERLLELYKGCGDKDSFMQMVELFCSDDDF